MANLCQTDFARVRPGDYFPETFRTNTCDACDEVTFVARASAIEARDAQRLALMDLPLAPEDAERVHGPELGARVRYVGSIGMFAGYTGTVTARSYVWAPDKVYTMSDGSRHRGIRLYEDSVVDFDYGRSMVVLDRDLEVIS